MQHLISSVASLVFTYVVPNELGKPLFLDSTAEGLESPSDCHDYSPPAKISLTDDYNTATRGHPFKLRIKPSKNYKCLNGCCNRSVHIWNSLTSYIVTCSSITAFKRDLKSVNLFKFQKLNYS